MKHLNISRYLIATLLTATLCLGSFFANAQTAPAAKPAAKAAAKPAVPGVAAVLRLPKVRWLL